jgi:N5-(cytidine 5'-diphosphoramidyl)-L-glutamine hydrolase
MRIGITPSVKETYKKQFEYSVDKRLIEFLENVFKKCEIVILISDKDLKKNFDLIIISGGNDIFSYKKIKQNYLRNQIDYKCVKKAINYNISIIGICYGAQFLANFFGNKIIKIKNHVRINHDLHIKNKLYLNKDKIKVNSFHNFGIINSSKNLEVLGVCEDKTIEFFKIKNQNFFGIMWHPERYISFRKNDIQILKKICN